MAGSNFSCTNYIVGNGSIEKLREYKDEKIALVVDENIVKALNLDALLYEDIFAESDYQVICNVSTEPTMEMMEESIKKVRMFAPTRIVGIGGGSVMDAAKALWLFRELPDYDWTKALVVHGVEKFPGTSKLTVIPTTSGTGSETTGCSVMKDAENRKRMILSREIIPTEAILDFNLLVSIPPKNIAFSGADALAHALESALSGRSNEYVQMVTCQAAVTLLRELPKSYKGDQEARKKVHIAASMAGMGIGNAGTGMAHGMDQAGGDFYLPHGLMTGLALPYTMLYQIPQKQYVMVAEQLGITGSDEEKQRQLVQRVFSMYEEIHMPKTLKEAGVPEQEYLDRIPSYIERAITDANIVGSPVDPTKEDLERLYKQFFYGVSIEQ